MTTSHMQLVATFHRKYKHAINLVPNILWNRLLPNINPRIATSCDKEIWLKTIDLRIELIKEETKEVCDALEDLKQIFNEKEYFNCIEKVADGLADLEYVVLGTGVSLGINQTVVFNEVHRSNMTKAAVRIKPGEKYGAGGGKGPNYSPPDIRGVLKLPKEKR